MAWIKAKTVIAVGAGALLTGAAVITLHGQIEENRRQEQAIRAEEQQISEQEQQIRLQEQQANLSADQRKHLDDQLNQLRARHDELHATHTQLRALQDQLREQDPNPFVKPSLQISPFTAMRFEGDKIVVTFDAAEYELASINDVAAPDLIGFARQQYKDDWQKRLAEDMVVVLADMQHPVPADHTVSLTLIDGRTGDNKIIPNAPMTAHNRQLILQARINAGTDNQPANASPGQPK
jgi:hypothetical protein